MSKHTYLEEDVKKKLFIEDATETVFMYSSKRIIMIRWGRRRRRRRRRKRRRRRRIRKRRIRKRRIRRRRFTSVAGPMLCSARNVIVTMKLGLLVFCNDHQHNDHNVRRIDPILVLFLKS